MKKPTKKTVIKGICIALPIVVAGVTAAFAPKIARNIRKKKYAVR